MCTDTIPVLAYVKIELFFADICYYQRINPKPITDMEKKIEYTNGELTIVWKPELCQHAGICVKMLPNVYHPKERPWVQIENATTEELIAQISKCPSGALSYRLNKKEK